MPGVRLLQSISCFSLGLCGVAAFQVFVIMRLGPEEAKASLVSVAYVARSGE